MGHYITANDSAVLIVQTLFILLFLFPDFSFILWKSLMKNRGLHRAKTLANRNRKTEEKMGKYRVIDFRRLK